MRNFTPIDNDIKRVFFDDSNDLDYGDFAVYTYILMFIQFSENGRDGKPNGKQGYCYKTKIAMRSDLRISKGKLNRHIDNLKKFGFIGFREVKNKYGGQPLEEYRLSDEWKKLL